MYGYVEMFGISMPFDNGRRYQGAPCGYCLIAKLWGSVYTQLWGVVRPTAGLDDNM